jgi:crotonobetaine/carnitine-CoA ligase
MMQQSESQPERGSLQEALASAAAQHGDKTWIASRSARLSFSEANERSDRLADGLIAQGVRQGDRVLTMLPDGPDSVVTWCALAKAGAVEVPVNTAHKGSMLVHLINDSAAGLSICHVEFLGQVQEIQDDLAHLKSIALAGSSESSKAVESTKERFEFHRFDEMSAGAERRDHYRASPHDLMAIVYTSGTTGPSKGVMVAHAHAQQYAATVAGSVGLCESDVYYTAGLPLFHVAAKWGVVYGCLLVGATAAISEGFSVSRYWDDIRYFGATASGMLGAMGSLLYRQAPSKEDDATTLERVCMVPLIPELDDFMKRFGLRVSTAYGSTESGAPAVLPLGSPVHDHRIAGKPLSDLYDVRIHGEAERELPAGEVGEIVVRWKKPWIGMLGYLNRPDVTVDAWRNLWFHTGDAGMMDADGNLYFVDRLKDCIRRMGENVSSSEVELGILGHDSVLACAVFPVPSDLTEDEIMAAVVLKPNESLSHGDLIGFLARKMAHFMVPRYIEFVEALPMTETGKVKKQVLSDRGVTDAAWDRVAAGKKIQQ